MWYYDAALVTAKKGSRNLPKNISLIKKDVRHVCCGVLRTRERWYRDADWLTSVFFRTICSVCTGLSGVPSLRIAVDLLQTMQYMSGQRLICWELTCSQCSHCNRCRPTDVYEFVFAACRLCTEVSEESYMTVAVNSWNVMHYVSAQRLVYRKPSCCRLGQIDGCGMTCMFAFSRVPWNIYL